ncbi:hypothetical protein [Thiorhodovibrio frisius]|uniref:Uncharacterized protein n=1 Tax=Thiorhodovibrio frisius TaxID=631362 RepID=H8Z3G1_9GAMM|nr:hypothetical protein [Thiorhodovibrio frisius]EIC21869.1 hypothetical protein Thi970DRAFT_02104 [Thiorhodovibrio frisius]WPL24158.1 hypothetical protein Thiofri_04372 [Thiorhodovibrio frisius]
MTIDSAWLAENCPQPTLLPGSVSALDIARWYAHDLANFLLAPSYCDNLRTYLPVWRLPLPERWFFVPHSVEETAMHCYRSAIREALERGSGSTGGHEIAQVLEEWAAAPVFKHPELDGIRASLLPDRTLELRYPDALGSDPNTAAREQYRVIGRRAHHRRLPPDSGSTCWAKEPDWAPWVWNQASGNQASGNQTRGNQGNRSQDGEDIVNAFLRHEGAQPDDVN